MPYRLDLAAMRPHELSRALPRAEYLLYRPALAAARLTRKPVFAPEPYPDTLELRVAAEEDWDALGASLEHATAARAMRDTLHDLGFRQTGAFRLGAMPFPRNFFAYLKEPDVFAAIYVSDAAGPAPYLELLTRFAAPRSGKEGSG